MGQTMFHRLLGAALTLLFVVSSNASFFSFNRQQRDQGSCQPMQLPSMLLSYDVTDCAMNTLQNRNRRPTDDCKTTAEIITSFSYNVTTHHVVSMDGYITAVYRITGSPYSPPRKGKRSVLLVHGFAGSSKHWVMQHGNKNLAMELADIGYEVWIPSIRGTSPSRGHIRLDSYRNLAYWDFGIDTIATNDIPIIINLMLKETETEKIDFICHSMGCFIYLVAVIDNPELQTKIRSSILMAPSLFLGRSYHFIHRLSQVIPRYMEMSVFTTFGGRVDTNPNDFLASLGLTMSSFCTPAIIRCGICNNVLSVVYGFDGPQLNYTNLPNVLNKLVDNMPLRLLFHLMQNHRTCGFRRYDHGPRKNMNIYGMQTPPAYNLRGVKTPMYIFFGAMDNIVPPLDLEQLKNALPPGTVRGFHRVEWPLFNHIDFLAAKDADVLVYHKILKILNSL